MTKHKSLQRLAALVLAAALAISLTPAAFAASSGMDNFKKVLVYPGFADVSESAWYAKNVRAVYELGFMNGKSASRFDPNGQLTVAEAITLAVRVAAIYYGVPFTSGGTPWYQKSVEFAEKYGLISEGQFTQADYNRPATRSEVAMLLFETIGTSDYDRINRITYIPDITTKTQSWNEIYLLYNAGVLTGKGTLVNGQLSGDMAGSFFPDDTITRAEAAAIMHRVAVPSERVRFSLSSHRPGQVVTAADDSFRISIPKNEGWTVTLNKVSDKGAGLFRCTQKNGGADLRIATLPARRWGNTDLAYFAADTVMSGVELWWDGTVDKESAATGIVRGLYGYSISYSFTENGKDFQGLSFFTENSEYRYGFFFSCPADDTGEQYSRLTGLMLSLDMAL